MSPEADGLQRPSHSKLAHSPASPRTFPHVPPARLPIPTHSTTPPLVLIPLPFDSPGILLSVSLRLVLPSRPLPRNITPAMSPFRRRRGASRHVPHPLPGLDPLRVPINRLSLP